MTYRLIKVNIVLLATFLLTAGFTPPDENLIFNLASKLESYNTKFPSEKIFIHTDKTKYSPGEAMWFKGYVFSSQNLGIPVSSEVFVRLCDEFGNNVFYLRYPLDSNTFTGYQSLPEKLIPGKYKFIAYTGWMRNNPANEVFTKDILVGEFVKNSVESTIRFDKSFYNPGEMLVAEMEIMDNNGKAVPDLKLMIELFDENGILLNDIVNTNPSGKVVKQILLPENAGDLLFIQITSDNNNYPLKRIKRIPVVPGKINMKFYPESGSIINGVTNKIYIHTTDEYNIPVSISGNVTDNLNKITKVTTDQDGMGYFFLAPREGSKYSILLDKNFGIDKSYPLPDISNNKYLLNYRGLRDSSLFFILHSSNANKVETTYLVITKDNKVVWGAQIDFQKIKYVLIPVKDIPSGIQQISVFDETNKLLANMTVAVNDNLSKISISSDKNLYQPFEEVHLKLHAPVGFNASAGSFSLAVIAENTLKESLEAKSVFKNEFQINNLLQHGNSDFYNECLLSEKLHNRTIWYELDDRQDSNPADFLGKSISGRIYDKKDMPIDNAVITITDYLDKKIFVTNSDTTGYFSTFFNTEYINLDNLEISATSDKKIKNYAIKLDNSFESEVSETFLSDIHDWQEDKYVLLAKYEIPEILYSEPYESPKKKDVLYKNKQYDKKQYSSFTSVVDILKTMKYFNVMDNKIVFRPTSINYQDGALIVIDGAKTGTDIGILRNLSPSLIENIEILTEPSEYMIYTSMNTQGVIVISTTKEQPLSDISVENNTNKNTDILYDKSFVPGTAKNNSDAEIRNRTTLYWDTDLTFNNTNEVDISFFNSGVTGNFVCVLQGIDRKGNLYFSQFKFEVR
ncbi:MAG: hypothetical protein JXJ22_09785 [Bacteroidales bacterium]|nr:hypothetical protein [Bacteroidales bacterium]